MVSIFVSQALAELLALTLVGSGFNFCFNQDARFSIVKIHFTILIYIWLFNGLLFNCLINCLLSI